MIKQMREILFRGKRIDNREWVYGNHLYDDMTGKHFIVPFDNISESTKVNEEGCCYCVGFEVIPETVGQYTGLIDKNGNKIFEGDILKSKVHSKNFQKAEKRLWTVEYKERCTQGNGFYVYGINRRFNIMLTQSVITNCDCEIIGNIHDNPELLEVSE